MTSSLKLAFCKRVAQGQDISSTTAASPYQLREKKREEEGENRDIRITDLRDENL